jgi:hypothetical protein
MAWFGVREVQDDNISLDSMASISMNPEGESACSRHWLRMINCLRESQELDVLFDCRSRLLDFRECSTRSKQSMWVFRESVVSMRNRDKLYNWLERYDEEFGHPPILEAVEKVRRKLATEGGIERLHPTHFKDPETY